MIAFNGYISGDAEKYFWRRARALGQKILAVAWAILLPVFVLIAIKEGQWFLLLTYCIMAIVIYLLTYIPQSKKEKKSLTPKRIYTEDEYIVCDTDKGEDYRKISDAKQVLDFGGFYYIVFPLGKVSDSFICQKDLLTEGTIEEFESLFQGKIDRKYAD